MVHESTAHHAIHALQLNGEVHQIICSVHMKQKKKGKEKNIEICIPNKFAVYTLNANMADHSGSSGLLARKRV